MPETTIPFQVVIFTNRHSISGGIFLRDQRLSDFLNDRRDKNVMVRNASVARLENPTKILEKTLFSVVPKAGIVLAFEPPQKVFTPQRRFIKYPKNRHEVFLVMDGMEARGEVHVQGPLDLLHLLTDAGDSFLPITQASVTLEANPNFLLRRDAVVVNTQRILFMGEVQAPVSPTEPKPEKTN
ncbi:MAG: hypothetical protein FJZ96_15465 [Chloroflexi bacterium]|nr:hypothetical protein [Chloroflexota bacterium]